MTDNFENQEYVKLCEEIDSVSRFQKKLSFKEKFMKNVKENVLITAGAGLTVTALGVGLWSMNKGNSKLQQSMMRLRVGAQLFTIMAVTVAMYTATRR